MTADLMKRLAGKLLCPACGDASLAVDGGALSCRTCASKFAVAGPMVDLARDDGALHLFPDPGAVARSVFESLESGGVFVCATYLRGTSTTIVRDQKRVARNSGFHWFTPGELKEIFSNAGFSGFEHHVNKVGIVARAVRG